MFCIKCGTRLSDEAIFCSNCGQRVEREKINEADGVSPEIQETVKETQPPEIQETAKETQTPEIQETPKEAEAYDNYEAANGEFVQEHSQETETVYSAETESYNNPVEVAPKKKRKLLYAVVFASVAIVLCITLFFVFGNDQSSPEKTIKKYVNATVEGDEDEIVEIMYPKKVLYGILSEYDMSYDEFEENLEERAEYMEEEFEKQYGRGVRANVRMLKSERLSKEEIIGKEEAICSRFDVDVKISDARRLECEMTIRGSENYETDTDTLTVYKIGRKWYLLEIW